MRIWSMNLNWSYKADSLLQNSLNKIRNEIEQLLSKYKHGNVIYEHEKQQNELTVNLFSSQRLNLKVQINILLFKAYLFITCRKI